MIGFFVNTLALRVRLGDGLDVAQLLAQVKASTLDAYAHQDVPFEQVVEVLKPQRSLGHSPVFQVTLAMNNSGAGGTVQLPGLTLEGMEHVSPTTPFDLALSVTEAGSSVALDLSYATDLFDRATADRLLLQLRLVLGAMAADARQAIARLPLMDEAERDRVVSGFNRTARSYPDDCAIHQVFEAQVARRPDATAIVCGAQSLSYGELDRQAGLLAARLAPHGLAPDTPVAICMERSIESVVAMLAVLKAGGAYVPLDPAYPAARLAQLLASCAPAAVLACGAQPLESALAQALQSMAAAPLLVDVSQAPAPDARALSIAAGPRQLAYVIYTSGSTGEPKGVMVEHGNVLRLAVNGGYAELGATDRVAHCSSPAFDAATWEIWAPLLNGAAIVIIARDDVLSPQRLGAALEHGKATALWMTAGLFHQYAAQMTASFGQLRYLLVGGDVVEPAVAARVLAAPLRPGRLINGYGPTEGTTFTTTYDIGELAAGARSIPIGRPIGNTQVYILDALLQPVPVGVVGELYIGGAGVARGYLNQPDLTAERFVNDPFSAQAGARLYRSGDQGRWREDGAIEYLGRNDFQLKLRGFRIEPGEIEARLRACAGVREALVVAREERAGHKRLVAYIVADGVAPAAAQLRAELAQHLAEYMLPAAFVVLERLPLTPNGKVDRQALPAPDAGALASREYQAPRGESEAAMAAIWQTLLGVPRVGRHDHFFELGGHSLLAVQVVSQVRARLGMELALRHLFESPVLADCAAALAAADPTAQAAMELADRAGKLPLSWSQQRLWFLDRLDRAAGAAYHIPVALRLCGELDAEALAHSLDRIVARHENLRTTFVLEQDEALQRIAPATAGFALQRQDLGGLAAAEQEAALATLAAEEAAAPFDLAAGPLIRGRLLRLGPQEHVLLVTMHHIVSDGWSIGVGAACCAWGRRNTCCW
ncbi:non-ribosomal peptide synthetase [Duganella sp. Root1480D1]|uniref:non-ribosomal peptide synthetase n=1 Tax=Duganella sp. Root1480D1 TaxID=1736471 RepID=UPI00070FD184|nr:hypothetical protein ASD58_30150 [Duganella sp. Root1480D1]